MVEDTAPFTPEQQAKLDELFGRYARTKAAQDAAAADNERVALLNKLAETNPLQPAPAQPAVDRRLTQTGEWRWTVVPAGIVIAVLELLEQPDFTEAVGRIGEAAMPSGELDVGQICITALAAAVFLGRQYAKAKAAQGGGA